MNLILRQLTDLERKVGRLDVDDFKQNDKRTIQRSVIDLEKTIKNYIRLMNAKEEK